MHRLAIIALAVTWPAMQAAAAVLDAGPADGPGIRSVFGIDAAEVPPGTLIRLHAGHYPRPIVIPVSGTQDSRVIVEGAGDGAQRIDGGIVLDGAAFVTVRQLHLQGDGIILRGGSHDILVRDNRIDDPKLGIWIGAGAGDHDLIAGNTITGSQTHGIAVDGVNAAPGRETIIAGNRIFDSGVHGIELSGNDYIIENNIVSGNGRASIGASGIHVYARDALAHVGRHNILRGNIAIGTHAAAAQDGNGIQLDQWCDDNVVAGNIAADNDGAGISVFDAARARIIGNTLYGNMRDPGRSHRHKGELIFATDDEHDVDGTRDAVAEANIVVATNPHAAAIVVDVPTTGHPPRFARNLLGHEAGGSLARWAGRDIAGIAAWNALAPHSAPDLAGVPRFVDPAKPWQSGFTLAPGQPAAWQGLGWK